MKRKSLLFKIIVFGSVLSIIPVVLLGLFSYFQSSRQVQDRVSQAEQQFLSQLHSNVEQVLKTVEHTLTNLVESRVMTDSLYSPMDASNFQLYNNLRSEITHMQSFDTQVEEVVLVNKQRDWVIRNAGITKLSEHPDRDKYFEMMADKQNTSWQLMNINDYVEARSIQGCPYMLSVVKHLPNITLSKYALAIANIPVCNIIELMTDGSDQEEVLILDENQTIIVDRNLDMIGKQITEHPLLGEQATLAAASGQQKLHVANRSYTVSYQQSSFNNWVYVSIVSIDKLTKESRQIAWLTIYLCIFILLFSFVFIWLISNRLYTPLNRLVLAIEARNAGNLPKQKNEVQVIESHIKDLFYSNNKLELEVHRNARQVSSLFLQRMLSGSLRQSELSEKLSHFGYQQHVMTWRSLFVAAIQIDTLEHTRYGRNDWELLMFAVLNIAEETVPAHMRLPVVLMDRSVVLVVGMEDIPSEADSRMNQLAESLKQHVERYLSLSISIGLSLPFTAIAHGARGYTEALEALKHRLRLGKGIIISYRSIQPGKHSVIFEYPESTEHDLIEAIQLSHEGEALQLLHSWMHETIHKTLMPDEYHVSLVRLLNRLFVTAQEAGVRLGTEGATYELLYQELLTLHVGEEIEEWFRGRIVLPLVVQLAEKRESQDQNLSERIIDLIKHNYEAELTLEDCAVKLHYNPSYLSSVFKKETGSTFSEYLASYRMHMAKHWLTSTDMTIKEIAERLKYNNSHNFIRSFRKQEDMTPGQYRTQYRRM